MNVEIRIEAKRGCGWRKEGGLYLVGQGNPSPCGKLPLPLKVCPVCNSGIKPTRAWTWVDPSRLFKPGPCVRPYVVREECSSCPLNSPMDRGGLLWVGESFYKTPAMFAEEARTQGVSRRIARLPRGFKVGEDWVLLAHRKAVLIQDDEFPGGIMGPGIFYVFKPTAVEYVVKGSETPDALDALRKRGITPIKVQRKGEED